MGYIETHGTKTITGDFIEAQSIANTFCDDGPRDFSLFINSIKPNVGHLKSSSGITELIKTVLILEKGLIPLNLNLEVFKADLNLDAWKIEVKKTLISSL